MNVDVKNWKQFRLDDFFEIERGTSRVMRNLLDGDIPIIAAARADQGVAGFYDVQAEYSDEITISCNGVGCGSVFYHRGPFAITGDSAVMKAKFNLSENMKLFVTAVCDSLFSVKYSYAEKCNPAGLLDELISLPVMFDGAPDWAYMDAYMSEIMQKEKVYADQLASLTAEAVADGHVLDTSAWRAFRIGELFEIHKGRRLTKANQIDGNIPFIGATMFNNGVTSFIGNTEYVFQGHCLSVCYNGAVGVTFVQREPFWASDDVNVLYARESVSEQCLMFMAPLIEQVGKYNFAYVDKWTQEQMAASHIYLPVTSSGDPDWIFMEQYMRQQIDKAAELADHLDIIAGTYMC